MNWISVNDRLPQKSGFYIGYVKKFFNICDEDTVMPIIYYQPYTDGRPGDWVCKDWHDEYDLINGLVTHWMSLPEPPRMEECNE